MRGSKHDTCRSSAPVQRCVIVAIELRKVAHHVRTAIFRFRRYSSSACRASCALPLAALAARRRPEDGPTPRHVMHIPRRLHSARPSPRRGATSAPARCAPRVLAQPLLRAAARRSQQPYQGTIELYLSEYLASIQRPAPPGKRAETVLLPPAPPQQKKSQKSQHDT